MALTNKTFNKLNNLELSIQISLSGLSFCILQRDTHTIINLKEVSFQKKLNPLEVLDYLKHLFNTENVTQHTYNSITIIHDNELSTLVPKPLFNEECIADYLKFNSKILVSDFIAHDEVLVNDSVNVYVPYININNFIYDQFGAFTFKHVSTVLIEEILQLEKNASTPKVYVNISKSHFEIIIVDNAKLILYNTFEYNTPEDFIYYVLFATEQLNLNPETFSLVFIGDVSKEDALYTIAYKYIRNISFGNRNETFSYIEKPKTNHSNFTLIKSL
ncbi:uncharacterized protein DUF3822 [Mariniflexile fucanivorans]|uniref:Uncharacterized protein DUF3822 n=2 Tax=Mariniflexile fucanivorans TaxID=264023 RepID=A0A4R1RGC9_9FLAO|nr:DUF3822 family protein [Mariniflexile fucanivorans]TCL65044.1 uncharacterized protein DUF3822 [Mariniflexile fucanivorans]